MELKHLNPARTRYARNIGLPAGGRQVGVSRRTLYEEIFAVFERACREGDFELADHILLALETIARRQKDNQRLDRAYLLLASI